MKKQLPLIQKGWLRALVFLVSWLILQIALNGILYVGIRSYFQGATPDSISSFGFLMMSVVSLLANLSICWIFRKNIDRQSFSSLGFLWKGAEPHAYTGFFIALLILSFGTLVYLLGGNLRYLGIEFHLVSILTYLALMLVVAVSEEIVIRGYILNNLLESFPKWIALLVSALLFSIFHLLNPSVNLLSMLGIFIGGLLLGVNYIYTGNLWFGIFFHFAWNFFQGPILGYAVSGIEMESVLVPSLHGSSWWTGGAFGFEASILADLLNLFAAIFLYWYYEKKQLFALYPALPK